MTKSDITYQEKLNELRLDISHPKSQGVNFVLLEGDSDIRLFRKFFDLDKCKVENIPGGNPKLEECVGTLVNIYPLIIGIRDSDFLQIINPEYAKRNMFLTDQHDIETTMLNFKPVLNALVFEYSSKKEDEHEQLKSQLIDIILSLSSLKLINERDSIGLNFSPGFQDLVSFANSSFDLEQYITRVLGKSESATITDIPSIIRMVNDVRETNPEKLQITNGHDLLNIFAKYFREIEGRNGIKGEQLETSLRMVFTKEMFEETKLYENLNEWQQNNTTELF